MLTCGRVFLVACLTAVAAATTVVVTPNPAGATTPPSTIGVDHDQAGTSWYPDQTALTPQLVQGGSFGQLFGTQLQGDIQAQPLVDDGVLLVETEENWAYGLNPASGAIEWSKYLGTPFDSASLGCSDLPSDGVTGTPVVDTSTNIEYFTSVTYASGTSGPAQYWMHALSVTNGQEEPGFPALISGNASNDPNQSFNATYQLQRPGLLLMNGVVYAAFGSHCDIAPTNGWVIGVTTGGAISTLWSSEAGIDNGDGLGGIWAPGALRSDGPGQILLSTGNGYDPTAPAAGNSNPEPGQLAEAVVRLTVQPNGSLQTTDFFVPLDAAALNQTDGDLGSGSPVVLPSEFSTSKYPELAVEIGKEGYLYVLDASDLGGYEQGPDGSDHVLARLGPVQGVWGSPAVWGGDGGYLYVVTNGGSADGAPGATDGKLLAWKFGVDGSGNPTFALVGSSTDAFGYSSSSPVVTSSGTTSGTNILWVNWADGPGSTTAQLRAYNPIPDANGNLDLLWSAPSGASVKLSEPGVGGNRVYVGGFDGVIRGFGSPVAEPLVRWVPRLFEHRRGAILHAFRHLHRHHCDHGDRCLRLGQRVCDRKYHSRAACLARRRPDLVVTGEVLTDHVRHRGRCADRCHQCRQLLGGSRRDRSERDRALDLVADHHQLRGNADRFERHRGRGLHQPGEPEPHHHRRDAPGRALQRVRTTARRHRARPRRVGQRQLHLLADRGRLLPRRPHAPERHRRVVDGQPFGDGGDTGTAPSVPDLPRLRDRARGRSLHRNLRGDQRRRNAPLHHQVETPG